MATFETMPPETMARRPHPLAYIQRQWHTFALVILYIFFRPTFEKHIAPLSAQFDPSPVSTYIWFGLIIATICYTIILIRRRYVLSERVETLGARHPFRLVVIIVSKEFQTTSNKNPRRMDVAIHQQYRLAIHRPPASHRRMYHCSSSVQLGKVLGERLV